MSIIDETYFINDISLPNLTKTTQLAKIGQAIDNYEVELLESVLGYSLYKLYKASPSDTRFSNITDGDEFTFDFNGKEVTRKYIGLANSVKKSMLAYYVYFMYRRQEATITTDVGETKPKSENAEIASERFKMVNAWNNMVHLVGIPRSGFQKLEQSSYNYCNDDGSLYNYLLTNIEEYPEWEFSYPNLNNELNVKPKINVFDL